MYKTCTKNKTLDKLSLFKPSSSSALNDPHICMCVCSFFLLISLAIPTNTILLLYLVQFIACMHVYQYTDRKQITHHESV